MDDFIGVDPPNLLPKTWGGNATQRHGSAVFVAMASAMPAELLAPKMMVDANPDQHAHVDRQREFARLFALAPDFFVALTQYVRTRASEMHQVAIVARALHFEAEALMFAQDGSARTDKEIAAILEAREGSNLKGVHPSVIGKARQYIARSAARMDQKLDERLFEAGTEAIAFLNELIGIK